MEWIFEHEPALRFGIFAGMLTLISSVETLWPRRKRRETRLWRWPGNLGIMAISTLILRLIVPMGAVGAAFAAETYHVGILHWVDLPPALTIVFFNDTATTEIYTQHWVAHNMPILWKLHQVHHADRDFDATTAIRFHPLEILVSIGIKVGAVVVLGAPPLAVLLFEIILNAAALFNHGNTRLPLWLDRILRLFLVTPDMHRVHHSTLMHETNSNYGFNLPWWDYLFGTYRAQPEAGQEGFVVGLPEYQEEKQSLWWLLLLPFRRSR
jgi:sterol desaturase/sphingolipid hydroxylase (fatty acid hydroxylase superfamily)